MARNPYFTLGTTDEQTIYEDIIVESIQIYGQIFYYIPRVLVGKDEILGEDRLSQFKKAYPIEMYLESHDGFEGQGAFIQKFGLMMEQSATLTVARRSWQQLVGKHKDTIVQTRPCEGDLLYFPLTGGLFEIKFVQHQDPFYQLGKLYVYKLQVELFQYASEKIDTGIKAIDAFETLKSFDEDIVKDGHVTSIITTSRGQNYTTAPLVHIGNEWLAETAYNAGDVICFDDRKYVVSRAGTSGTTEPTHISGYQDNGTTQLTYTGARASAHAVLGTGNLAGQVLQIILDTPGAGYTSAPPIHFVGDGTGAAARAVIGNVDNIDSFGDNNKFRQQAEGLLFSESNPFGEITDIRY